MPLKTEPIDEPNLNLTPMIDIVFLLIIFFMVGTQFTEMERQFDLQLPTVSDVQPLTSRPDPITVNVHRNGLIRLGDRIVSLPELEEELTEARRNFAAQAVLIRGEGDSLYQNVMDVMAVCQRADISSVSQAVRLREPQEP